MPGGRRGGARFLGDDDNRRSRAAYRQIAIPTLVCAALGPRGRWRIAELVAESLPEVAYRPTGRATCPRKHKEAVNAAVAEHSRQHGPLRPAAA